MHLHRAISTIKAVLKVDSHLRHFRLAVLLCRGDLDGREQVLFAVRADGAERKLTAGKDYGLGQILQ
jgi:hypothetical protein